LNNLQKFNYPISALRERRNFLLEKNMCLNWCRSCQGKKHNHVSCPQRVEVSTKHQGTSSAIKKVHRHGSCRRRSTRQRAKKHTHRQKSHKRTE
uniref:Nucleic-acid-binding protein from transposon X-element n=1 Tax=Haemonchus placei TaxID=6290 RepID=A0A0N4VU20_HAEPC